MSSVQPQEQLQDVVRVLVWANVVCLLSYLLVFALIATSPSTPVYDEAWYLGTLDLLRREGLSITFFRDLPGPAGPTFTWVYGAVQRVLALQLPWVRLVSLALLGASALVLERVLANLSVVIPGLSAPQSSRLIAGIFFALPTVAVSAGMTLTEMPALFFLVVALWSILRAENDRRYLAVWSAVAGIALGLAVLGRQNYLVVLPCLLLLADWPVQISRFRVPLIVGSVAGLLIVPVFFIWGGLTPVRASGAGKDIIPYHFVLGAGYLGILTFLLAPAVFRRIAHGKDLLIVLVLAGATVLLIGQPYTPMMSVLAAAGPGIRWLVSWVFTIAVAIAAYAFLAATFRHLWDHRNERWTRFFDTLVLLGAASNAKIFQFSSRYIFVFLPFLLLALARDIRLSWHLPARLAVGALVGAASLASYFR